MEIWGRAKEEVGGWLDLKEILSDFPDVDLLAWR